MMLMLRYAAHTLASYAGLRHALLLRCYAMLR